MNKTLNEYIERLRPVQQDLIVACVREYSQNREELHRGTLPFLSAQEAANALRIRLELLKSAPLNQDGSVSPIIGEKIIRQTLSVFLDACHKDISDEVSVTMELDSVKLKKRYGRRMTQKFTLFWHHLDIQIELKMINKNKWRVTCPKRLSNEVTTYLAENFR